MMTYSFSDVVAGIVGPNGGFPIGNGSGIAKEGITISPVAKDTMVIGADGSYMHSKHADQSATLTIRLLKASPTNALLSALYGLDDLMPASAGQNVITVFSVGLLDNWVCSGCAFSKFPDTTYAEEGGTMEWTFNVGRASRTLGGGGLVGGILGAGIQGLSSLAGVAFG